MTATAEVVEKVAFVGARQILTTARPDAWGSGVGVLHQAYIDDVSGALVDVRLTKALGRRSSVRIGIFKEGNSLSVSGVSDLLDGVSFTEGGLRAFVSSIIDVVPDGAGQLRIILDKGLSARLSDQELVFRVNGREPTASQLAVIEDDPEVRWDFTNRIVLNTNRLEFFNLEDATNRLIADNLLDRASENRLNWLTRWLSSCPDNGIRGIRFGHQDGFMISEMSVKLYDCVSGLNTEGFDVIVEGGKTLAEDVMWMLLSAKVAAVAGAVSPATGGSSLLVAGAAAFQAITEFISTVGDIKYILTAGGATLVEKNAPSTRVNFLGEFTADGKMIQGAEYLPWLMVRNDKSEEEIIALRLRKGDEYIHFAELQVKHDRGYFVIPPNAMTLALDDPSDDSESVEFEMDTPGFFDRNVTLEIAARAYLPKFAVVKRFEESENVVFLDASSSLLPDNGRATYQWSYYTEQGSRVSLGSAVRLKVPVAAFAGVAEGQNFVMIQLDVVIGDEKESVRRTVVLVGASSWNEGVVNDRDYVLVEVPDSLGDGGLPSGALASYRDFHVIAHDLDETQSHDGACKAQLGSSVRLADWNDVVAYYDGGGLLPAFIAGLKLGVYGEALTGDQLAGGYRLSANGNSIWPERQAHGLDRHYFLARHDHSRPDYFLAHADLDNHHLSLGSWYGQGGYALCYGDVSGGGGGSTGQEQSFSLPGGAEMEFVWIGPGVFQMGSPESEPGRSWVERLHEVEISRGFWLGKYEVTQGEWESVMGSNPSDYTGDARRPVESVSWSDVQEFIGKLNAAAGDSLYRLPSEAEWEYACRAGTQTRWSFGDDESRLGDYAWYSGNNDPNSTKVVGQKLPNAWGLYDMHGNAAEWVQDIYDSRYYGNSPRVDPRGRDPVAPGRLVTRGGGFGHSARFLRSAYRDAEPSFDEGPWLGVRLVRIPSEGAVSDDGDVSGMEFVWIEPGVFQMGGDRRHNQKPVHEVEISQGFYLGKYEITRGQWEAVMGETPRYGSDYGYVESRLNSSHPVVSISWHDVQHFIAKLNDAAGDSLYRLPTEAEWEYACRAGTTTRWSSGDDSAQLRSHAWTNRNTEDPLIVGRQVHMVGTRDPNPWGLYDMHGNAAEWVQDWYGEDYYNSSPRVDPQGPDSGSARVIRGGSIHGLSESASAYRDSWAPDVRSYYRISLNPEVYSGYFGARLLRIR